GAVLDLHVPDEMRRQRRRVLRGAPRVLELPDAVLELGPVVVHQMAHRPRLVLTPARHPVAAVRGEEGEPLLEAALVEEPRLLVEEVFGLRPAQRGHLRDPSSPISIAAVGCPATGNRSWRGRGSAIGVTPGTTGARSRPWRS